MNEWYYARGGQQSGPVTFPALAALARSGGLAATDLVWISSMKDWTPAGQVPGLFDAAAGQAKPMGATADPANPYAPPQSAWEAPIASHATALSEIIPGSEPID